jgi:subtilisin family serine protease
MNHVEITLRQNQQLGSLMDADVRRDLQNNLLFRRAQGTPEPDGLRRPALRSLPARRRPADRVLVTNAELLVTGGNAAAARDALLEGREDDLAGQFQIEEICAGVERVVLPFEIELDDALDRLAGGSITASANHVVMMGGTAKGGATPKATTETIAAQVADTVKTSPPEVQPDGPLIVVIDTGIDEDASQRNDGWVEYVTPVGGPRDIDPLDVLDQLGAVGKDGKLDLAAGHGTFVAGIISQVAPTAEIVMIRAITTDGVCSEEELIRAVCRAAEVFMERGRDRGVVNLSLGLETVDDEEPPALRRALDLLPDEVIVVAAAGNAKTGVKLWPAASDRACGVASLANEVQPSSWSNCGSWVDFSARGEGVVSTYVVGEETAAIPGEVGSPFDQMPDRYKDPDPVAVWSGTSFSTPQIAGRFANILEDEPTVTLQEAITELKKLGPGPLTHYGHRVHTL